MLGMDQSPLQLWIKVQMASPAEALLSPWVGQGAGTLLPGQALPWVCLKSWNFL